MWNKPKWAKAGQDGIELNWKVNWKSKDISKQAFINAILAKFGTTVLEGLIKNMLKSKEKLQAKKVNWPSS